MTLFPDSAPAQLGFDAVRARLVHHALGAEAADRLAALGPLGAAAEVRAALGRTAELADLLRFDDPVPFGAVLDLREALRRIAPEGGTALPDDLLALRRTLETVRRLAAYFGARRAKAPAMAALAAGLVPLPDLEALLGRVVDDDGTVRDTASPELARLRKTLARTSAALRDAVMDELRRAREAGYAAEEQPTVRGGRLVLPIRAEAKRKIPGFVHDTSATGQTVYLEPASALDLGNDLRELEVAERREVERVLREASGEARAHLDALRPSLAALTALDEAQARARLALDLDAAPYEVGEDGIVALAEVGHPALLLRLKAEGRGVVPLSLRLDGDARTVVITGPNAGGKSVALKTVGLAVLMAACGLPLPCGPGTRVDVFDALFADIGDAQSLDDDLSTFSSHVAKLRRMLDEAGPRTLVLLDEAGTGTDPAEGGALAQAVLERLTEAGARTIATTHIGALKAFAHAHPHVRNGAMRFDTATLAPTYRFDPDVPGASYALEVAARGGLDGALLDRARALVGTQGAALGDLILDFQARTADLDARQRAAAAAEVAAAEARADFEERRDTIRRQRDALRTEALAEAERIVKEAGARVERTIREIKEAGAAKEATQAARADLAAFAAHVEGRQQKQAKRRPKPPRPAPAAEPLRVGDRVRLDGDGGTEAEVVALDAKGATIAVGSVKMRVDPVRLRRLGGPARQTVEVRHVNGAPGGLAVLDARTHLDVRGHRLDEALADLPRFLDRAVSAGVERVEILHGKGTGALRQGLREWLAKQPEVADFEDAPWEQGGPGVTVVTLR